MMTLEQLQEKYNLAVNKAPYQAKTLYLVTEPADFSDKLSLACLEGIVAGKTDEQIMISTGSLALYRSILTNDFGVKFLSRVDKLACNTWNLVSHYQDLITGYILCDDSSDRESVSVAISLAGLLDAVVVTADHEETAKEAGLTCVLDVRGKTDSWLRSSEYFAQLNTKLAFEQPSSMAPKLVDYSVMSKSYFSFYNGTNSSEHAAKYEFLDDNAVVFGYNNTLGEYDTVNSFSAKNICMVPSDHAYNLSTLSGFCLDSIQQNRKESEEETPEQVHTVCLIMSDGDNMQWLTNDFLSSEKWFASKVRGDFPLGWGVPATAIDVTAPILSYLYQNQTENDEFIMQLSGIGYTFPSKWSSSARTEMAAQLSEYMIRSDLKYAEILDDGGFSTRYLSAFTKQDGIEGLFYIDYGNYANYGGKILWSNGKPVVSARYRLWGGVSDGSIEYISNQINAASTDPKSADAYSFIIVHAWSGDNGKGTIVGDGNTMNGIQKLIESFDSDVQVVTPTEFMNRIIENLGE
ncbi:MAG: hypothetical protein ACI3YK_02845 [Eubacteriales bacterium]